MVNHLVSIISFTGKEKRMQKTPSNRLKELPICDCYTKNTTLKIQKIQLLHLRILIKRHTVEG